MQPGRCYGFFGRNGAGKTTTIKCLLNLLRPTSGEVKVFGLDPARDEVAVKSRLAYVPDAVAFYPWMTVRDTLDYFASFRDTLELSRPSARCSTSSGSMSRQKTSHLSKGQRTQLALITAICPEPELLVLDEPTSGLDPIVRREFIQTVIGAYQDGEPGRRTVFVSTHLISEFEGLIDEFTIIERGRDVLTLDADAARERYQKIYARFAGEPTADRSRRRARAPPARPRDRGGRQRQRRRRHGAAARRVRPETLTTEALTLEEIFVATLQPAGRRGMTARRAAPVRREQGNPRSRRRLAGLPGRGAGHPLPRWLSCHPRTRNPGVPLGCCGARRAVDRPRVHPPHADPAALPTRSRARLFLVKLGVLAAMLLTLAAVAGAVVDRSCPRVGDAGVRCCCPCSAACSWRRG